MQLDLRRRHILQRHRSKRDASAEHRWPPLALVGGRAGGALVRLKRVLGNDPEAPVQGSVPLGWSSGNAWGAADLPPLGNKFVSAMTAQLVADIDRNWL